MSRIRYCHVCISCRDVKAVSKFYQEVFGCKPIDPPRNMKGKWAGQLIGCGEEHWDEASVVGEHITIPGFEDDVSLTFELLEYKPDGQDIERQIYDKGVTHICFEVPTEEEVGPLIEKVLAHGGSLVSEFPDFHKERVAYCRDIEGNLLEIRRPNDSPDTLRPLA